MNYIKVRSFDTNKVGVLEGCDEELSRGEVVVIESDEKGEDVVRVLGVSKEDSPTGVRYKFVRKVTPQDMEIFSRNEEESSKAFKTCKEKIKEQGLEMHLLKAYIPLSSRKIFFYYTSEERVDFRNLVRELAKVFKKRIEMRQVGVRDAVQILGWVGLCGEVPCCMKFMDKFDSISLKDIEEQNLPLSPSKFTGPCGRLICCMSFEKDNYLVKHLLPEKGSQLCIDNKVAKLIEVDPMRGLVILSFEDKTKEIPLSEILPKDYEKVIKSCQACGGCCRRVSEDSANYEFIAHN
ncbi:cell fate regulator YaaT (PSP1 superfamily) [Hydrogenivirga caldilitoris]|uniref:Cell fate regulator YaaT (PSP1 superfamily) n=1 Tax=Hydrogenivirga caldilitoris TaxID=246264 RepID=A0A497XQS7_9AQUI|nr:regulatory iron-sulfur-containing complex subunit RicT [Hydrogenivirga caldilitoris]RLJ71315.1 cell fate regulator YaaT (PSP1 superfamily) [Hydrogenivirga caldilitoris]